MYRDIKLFQRNNFIAQVTDWSWELRCPSSFPSLLEDRGISSCCVNEEKLSTRRICNDLITWRMHKKLCRIRTLFFFLILPLFELFFILFYRLSALFRFLIHVAKLLLFLRGHSEIWRKPFIENQNVHDMNKQLHTLEYRLYVPHLHVFEFRFQFIPTFSSYDKMFY